MSVCGGRFGCEACAKIGQSGAGDFEEEVAVNARGERGQARLAEKFINRRNLAEDVGFGGGSHEDISAHFGEIRDGHVRAQHCYAQLALA